jgi:GntR family transcriptional regulator
MPDPAFTSLAVSLSEPGGERQPRYLQIREQLLHRIDAGRLRRGDALPSEVQLARDFGVAVGTVRKAVDELVARNVLERRQGKGLYVASHDAATTLRLRFHLVDDAGRKELPAFHALLGIRTRQALQREVRVLGLADRARVTEMKRLRGFSDGSLMLEHVVLPETLFPQFAERLGNARPTLLYDFYERTFGVSVMNIEERVRAAIATPVQAGLIRCAKGSALLEIERRAYSHGNVPVELRVTYCESRNRSYFRARL